MTAIKKAALAFIAVAIAAGYHWHTHRGVTPKAANWKDVLAEARQGGYAIIDNDALWDRYQKDPDTAILVDTRQEWEYRTGHIKGALNFSIEPTWLSRWRNKSALEKFLGAVTQRPGQASGKQYVTFFNIPDR
jgi:hypothetical protein